MSRAVRKSEKVKCLSWFILLWAMPDEPAKGTKVTKRLTLVEIWNSINTCAFIWMMYGIRRNVLITNYEATIHRTSDIPSRTCDTRALLSAFTRFMYFQIAFPQQWESDWIQIIKNVFHFDYCFRSILPASRGTQQRSKNVFQVHRIMRTI